MKLTVIRTKEMWTKPGNPDYFGFILKYRFAIPGKGTDNLLVDCNPIRNIFQFGLWCLFVVKCMIFQSWFVHFVGQQISIYILQGIRCFQCLFGVIFN